MNPTWRAAPVVFHQNNSQNTINHWMMGHTLGHLVDVKPEHRSGRWDSDSSRAFIQAIICHRRVSMTMTLTMEPSVMSNTLLEQAIASHKRWSKTESLMLQWTIQQGDDGVTLCRVHLWCRLHTFHGNPAMMNPPIVR